MHIQEAVRFSTHIRRAHHGLRRSNQSVVAISGSAKMFNAP